MSCEWDPFWKSSTEETLLARQAYIAENDGRRLPSLSQVMTEYVKAHHAVSNSMATTKSFAFGEGLRSGEVHLKWWRNAPGMLLIKQVHLYPPRVEPQYAVTGAVQRVLADPALLALGLLTVRLEAVLYAPLLLKLEAHGWSLEGRREGGGEEELSGNADMSQTTLCCLCSASLGGTHGNNPWPVARVGECCDECNQRVVIPARMTSSA